MPNTKTAYSRTNSLQLVWITGDQVSIFCDQSIDSENHKTKADYDVTPDSTDPDLYAPSRKNGKLNLASTENKQGLRWGNAATPHNLYAVYPSIAKSGGNVIKETGKEGVFTFNFPKTQNCSKAGGYSPVNNTSKYMLKPNMNLAYMVAKQEGLTPTGNGVLLRFKPIASTLEITLQGQVQGDAVISGIDVNVKNLTGGFVKNDNANYQIQFTAKDKDFYLDVSKALTAYQSGVNTATFNIRLSDNGGNYTIGPGESVTFTVFLPPIKNLDDVEVICFDNEDHSLGKKQILTKIDYASPASKSFFTLPPLREYFDPYLDLTIDKYSITYPDTAQAKVMFCYLGGQEDVTSLCKFSSITTTPIVDSIGKIWAFGYGSKTIQATYTKNNVTYTATENINIGTYRTFERSDYMTYDDAMASINPPAYSKSDMATHLAKYVSFWDTEGPAYTFSGSDFGTSYNGTVRTEGRWILKKGKPAGTAQSLAEARTNGDYIFLPACGAFTSSGSFYNGGTYGYYWLSTPLPSNTNYAYDLNFYSGYASVNYYYYTNYYLVPMPKLVAP